FENAIRFLHNRFSEIESWNTRTERITDFNAEIHKLIQLKIAQLRNKLLFFEEEAIRNGVISGKSKAEVFISPVWSGSAMAFDEVEFIGEKDSDKILHALPVLAGIFQGQQTALRQIVQSSKIYLQYHINESGDIYPHTSLFIAFIEMYKLAQNEINKFTRRHLDYYFREILKFKELGHMPDKVHVCLVPAENVNDLFIPKGTKLNAGSDASGKPMVYSTDQDFMINKAAIEKVLVLLHDLENPEKNSFSHNVLKPEIYYIEHPKNRRFYQAYRHDKTLYPVLDKEIGFRISSSILLLEEGTRRLTFTFSFHKLSFAIFLKEIMHLSGNTGMDFDALDVFVSDFLQIRYSNSGNGFVGIPGENHEMKLLRNGSNQFVNKLEIRVLIPATEPSVDPVFSENGEQLMQPSFTFLVNPEFRFLYASFQKLKLEGVTIHVDTLGVSTLKLQNDFGLLDRNSPFDPFGPQPTVGSSFYIGHNTIFTHALSELYLNIDWYDVPGNDNGFAEYYKGYNYIESNNTFKAKVSLLHDKNWEPEEDQQIIPLFEDVVLDHDDYTPINNFRGIDNLDAEKLNARRVPAHSLTDFYNENTRNGYMKLELCFPPNGFGHKEYPDLISRAMTENARKKKSTKTPNEPYTPRIKSISVDYSSSLKLNDQANAAFGDSLTWIMPFGELEFSSSMYGNQGLIPPVDEGFELYLGLTDFSPPQTIGLLFQMDEFASDVMNDKVLIEWSYLHNNNWIKVLDNQIVYDTTNKLFRSGIVTLDFPNKISKSACTILPDGLFWLRLKCDKGLSFLQNILEIKPQVVSAVFQNNDNDLSHLEFGLPPESIKGTVDENSAIKSVIQSWPSFGGKKPEAQSDFYVRVSERLRHNDRAVGVWDYEHIILQEFPEVTTVKCLPNTTANLKPKQGHVLIVVLPEISRTNKPSKEPRFTIKRLQEMKEHLILRISPFVIPEIRNPLYESVQVRFNVRFNKGVDGRFHVQKLNDELKKLLSPWLFDDVQLFFGREIRGSSLLHFLDSRDYVDYVTNFAVYHVVGNKIINNARAKDTNVVLSPCTPISIFVSAEKHIINIIGDDEGSDVSGVNDMVVETDFIVEEYLDEIASTRFGIGSTAIEVSFQVDPEFVPQKKISDHIIRIKS
ncbi:MAG: hypothetical protein KKA07_13095, partial [Bacteroidetes bacterium]|nr:hypothetical protein [Bacteroidota bacterium]